MATQKQQNKISKVMREFYSGKLTTHGNKVTDVSQAKAIALSEAGVSKKKKKGAKKAKRKYAKGGKSVSKKVDLFENYEMIPAKVQKVLNKHIDDEEYSDLEQMLSELQPLGYTFEYGLDAVPFALRPIGVEVNELEGYEDYDADEFGKGGGVGEWKSGTTIKLKTKKEADRRLDLMKNNNESDTEFRNLRVDGNLNDGYVVKFEFLKKDKYAKGGSTGNIPKSLMDKINEINSLIKWAEDKDNFVGGYFGGTYYEYLDFEKPIETKNQFVYIEYNHGGGRKSSDRYNVNKKGEFDSNGLAELKSELSRILSAFRRAKKKYEQKGYFGEGGDVEKQNKEMVHSQVKEAKHHSEELSDILKEDKDIEAWVVAKMERATTDLSDVTHYLDGKDKSFAGGGGVGKTDTIAERYARLTEKEARRLDELQEKVKINEQTELEDAEFDRLVRKYRGWDKKANGGGVEGDCGCNGGDEYGTGGGVDHKCKCDEGGVYNNPFLKSIFGI